MKQLIKQSVLKAMTYKTYTALITDCVAKKTTTGYEQTQERITFTKLNASRMRRLNKTIKLSNEHIAIFNETTQQTWLVLTENWCGDASQTLPILNKIAEASSYIDLKIVLRDDNLKLMNAFLTNDAQAIPKLLIINQNFEVTNTWGARSKSATKLVMDYKKEFGKLDTEFKKNLQVWYNKDKGELIINDLLELIK